MTAPSRSLPLLALALGVAVLVVQIHVIVGGQTWNDVRYHTEVCPPRLAAATAVQRGDVPAWWDGSGLGVTLAGEPSHGALYPLHWLAATPRAFDLVIIAHLVWLALGVAVWARRRAGDRSALVAGVLVATTGIAMSAALRGALPAVAQLPWLVAAVEWLVHAPSPRERSRAALSIGVLVAAIALVGEAAVVVDAVALALTLGLAKRTARWLVAALAAGLAVGAVQWVPAIVQLPAGAGGHVAGIPLARLLEMLVPGAFGGGPGHAISAIAGEVPWAPSLFIGAPLLALAQIQAPSRRLIGVISGLAAAALVTGRGGWPAWLGAPELHVAALAVVLAPAAAGGIEALVLGQRRAVVALAAGAGLTAVALAALAVLRVQRADLATAIDRALVDGALGVACMVAGAVLAWRAPGRLVPVLFALLVAPSVGAAHSIAPAVDRAEVAEPPPWARLAEHLPPPVRVYRPVALSEQPTIEDAIATFAGGSAWRWGIAAARSEDPARSPVHDQVWLAAAHEGGALLDRYGIALAILPSTVVGARKLTALGRRGSWALTELPVAPPASVMRGWRWAVDPGDALALLFPGGGGTGILRGTTVLGGGGPPGPSSREPLPCAIAAWRDGDIELSCTTDAPGYAVVSSAAAPGWQVAIDEHGESAWGGDPTGFAGGAGGGAPRGIDGRDAAWLPADVMRRAVAIPAGTHQLHWRYELPGLRLDTVPIIPRTRCRVSRVTTFARPWRSPRRCRRSAR